MRTSRRPAGSIERVVPVYRNSTDIQEDSIDRQRKMVEPYAAKRPWKLLDPIKDEGVSGTEIERRPGMLALLALVKTGKVEGIIVDDISRLTRLDMIDLFWVLRQIRAAGVWIESVAQGRFDYTSMIGRVNLGLTTENKHAQAVETGRNTLTAYLRMARDLGEPPLPKTLYGYTRVEDMDKKPNKRGKRPGKWIVNDVQSGIVRQIFKWYVEGKPLSWIVRELHARAVASPSGNVLWSITVLKKTLTNDAYLGVRYWGKTASGKFWRLENSEVVPTRADAGVQFKPREEWMFQDGTHPAIIDRETFSAAQARREREANGEVEQGDGKGKRVVRRSTGPSGDPSRYILSKLLVCGQCGSWMSGFVQDKAKLVKEYMCCRYIAGGNAVCVCCRVKEEPMIRRLLKQIEDVLSPERQNAFRALLRERLKTDAKGNDLDALRKEERAVEQQLNHWRKLMGKVSDDMLSEVEEGIRQCRTSLARLQEQMKQIEEADPAQDLESALQEASKETWNLRQAFEDENRLAQREAMHGIIDHVVVVPVQVEDESGRKRFKPGRFEVVLRKGTGLALLSNFDPCSSASVEVRDFTFSVPA